MKRVAWILLLLALTTPGWAKTKITKQTFTFEGRVRTYFLFVPEVAEPMPVVLILHGYSLSDLQGIPKLKPISGNSMVDSWKDLAAKEHFIVVAPSDEGSKLNDVRNGEKLDIWNGDLNTPAFFRAVIDQVYTQHPIDPSRIYLFGDAEGAQYALSIAIVDANFYAAVALHAGALDSGYSAIMARANRRIPIAFWSGSMDMTCPLDSVRHTKAVLESNGFPVELTVLPNHGHDYFTLDGIINEKAWKFLKKAQFQPPQPE
jgi:poly(3-hydroxybutyrate) depolymerase